MTLMRAIAILRNLGNPRLSFSTEDIVKARQLGIEALQVIKRFRKYGSTVIPDRLPSETEV